MKRNINNESDYKTLSYEKLAKKYQRGDREALDEIVDRYENEDIIKMIVGRNSQGLFKVDRRELRSAVYNALMKAAKNFDLEKGDYFVVFANKWITFEVKKRYNKIREDRFTNKKKGEKEYLESLDEVSTDKDGLSRHEMVGDPRSDVIKDLLSKSTHEGIMKVISFLPDREQKVFRLFYGINENNTRYHLKKIANILGLSRGQVVRLKDKAKNKIILAIADKRKIESIIKKPSKIGLKSGTRKNNSNEKTKDESVAFDKIKIWDRIHQISKVLNKYLEDDFKKMFRIVGEKDQRLLVELSTFLVRMKITIRNEALVIEPIDCDEDISAAAREALPVIKFLREYLSPELDLETGPIPIKFDIVRFVKKFAKKVPSKDSMKEILRTFGINENTIRNYCNSPDVQFKENSM